MIGHRALEPGRATRVGTLFVALVAAAAAVQFGQVVWITAPGAVALMWIGGASVVSLVLGDHHLGRLFHAALAAVLGVVLMLVVALTLHWSGIGIGREQVTATAIAVCAGLAVCVVATRRQVLGVGRILVADVVSFVAAIAVLVASGGAALAMQPDPVHRYDVLALTTPAAGSSIVDRQVDPGVPLQVGFVLQTHGYALTSEPWASVALGDQSTSQVDIDDASTGTGRASTYRAETTLRTPEVAGVYRLVVRVRLTGPDGTPLDRQVTSTVVVR